MYNIGAPDPLSAQSFKTQRPNDPEDLWQPLYDRANIATPIPGQISFFSTPKGQNATLIAGTATANVVKSYRDTNIENAGVVPTKLYQFIGISLAFVHAAANNVNNTLDRAMVQTGGYLQFRIVDKDILYLPLIAVPVLNPVQGMATTVNNTTIMSADGGGGVGVAMYKFPVPITLNPYENFSLSANFTTAASLVLANALDMYVILHSFMRRPT
jgi:hypothetical protein